MDADRLYGPYLTPSSWPVQTKQRVSLPHPPSFFEGGGFQKWTDLQTRPEPEYMVQRRHFTPQPRTTGDLDSLEKGRARGMFNGVSTPVHATGKRQYNPHAPVQRERFGAKDVELSVGTILTSANPNMTGALCKPRRQEGVKFIRRVVSSNTALDPRPPKPEHAPETPVAWPAHPRYPPDRDASGATIDYALSTYGGSLRAMGANHPDLLKSRWNRAHLNSQPNQSMRSRHAGNTLY